VSNVLRRVAINEKPRRTRPAGASSFPPSFRHEPHTPHPFDLPSVRRKKLTVDFNGGNQSSSGGLLLLREKERALGVCRRLADSMPDRRDADRIRHAMLEMVMARVAAIACGYEDANDLDRLRHSNRNSIWTPAVMAHDFLGGTPHLRTDRRMEERCRRPGSTLDNIIVVNTARTPRSGSGYRRGMHRKWDRTIFVSTSSPIFAASLISRAMVARWRLVCFA
jgi:hypothetical protein